MKLNSYNKSTIQMIKRYLEEALTIDGSIKAENIPADVEAAIHVLGNAIEADAIKLVTELMLDASINSKPPEDSH